MLGLRKIGGTEVGKGNYWNFSTGERVHLSEGGVLPGDGNVSYYKVSPAALLVAAPVLGLAYAVFLPFIGIAVLAAAIGGKVFGGAAAGLWKGAAFSWKPSEAYLAGKKKKEEKKG